MNKIGIIGSGYVGLVTGACFANLGNQVICMDDDRKKIETLQNGEIPIYEPSLESLVKSNLKEERLNFTTSIEECVKNSETIFICVGTPPKESGEPDLSSVEKVIQGITKYAEGYKLIVEKSTVPVQTASWLKELVKKYKKTNVEIDIAVNPEFLREGSAVNDFMKPDRIVIGTENKVADSLLSEIYRPLDASVIHTDMNSAELIKHGSNAFLAMKISYANLLSRLCEETGADIQKVMGGIGSDERIGRKFLEAGIGYGGFCFPKDLEAFSKVFQQNGLDPLLLDAVKKINDSQRYRFVEKIVYELNGIKGTTIGVLGLSFKPNTDDMRFAPSLYIINDLLQKGASVKAYDPKAMDNAKRILNIQFCKDVYSVASDSDALAILTEWQEFKEMDLIKVKELLKNPIIFDGRNMFNPERMESLGFTYHSIGRKTKYS